jgi:hypothetical protein
VKNAFFIFRVFDVPYFVPGFVVMASLICWLRLTKPDTAGLADVLKLTESGAVFSGILLVVVTYLLGLACHAIGRCFAWAGHRFGRKFPDPNNNSTAFQELIRADPSLLQYFWYMRTLCLNLLPALVMATVAACLSLKDCWVRGFSLGFGLVFIALMYFLYRDFYLSYYSAAQVLRSQPAA